MRRVEGKKQVERKAGGRRRRSITEKKPETRESSKTRAEISRVVTKSKVEGKAGFREQSIDNWLKSIRDSHGIRVEEGIEVRGLSLTAGWLGSVE